jgi:hypothetical protein
MTYGAAELFIIPFVTIGNFLDYSDKQPKINYISLFPIFPGYRFFATAHRWHHLAYMIISVSMLLSILLGALKIDGSSLISQFLLSL